MKITVICKPNAKKARVERVDGSTYRVAVRAEPEDGEANREVLGLLADYFGVPAADIVILAGQKSRRKQVGIKGK